MPSYHHSNANQKRLDRTSSGTRSLRLPMRSRRNSKTTRIRPVIALNGRRVAFDQLLPWGTLIYRGDRVAWRVSEKYRDP
jgi:hypothetical protein